MLREEKKMKKKILTLLLLALVAVMALVSCARADTASALEAAPGLIESSKLLNEIYYGSGIPYTDEVGIGHYNYADEDYLRRVGFETIDELKAMTADTFSVGYSTTLYNTVLGGSSDTMGVVLARYCDSEAMIKGEGARDGRLLVYTNYTPLLIGERSYDYSTLKVVGSSGKDRVTLSLVVTITSEDGTTDGGETVDVDLVLEDGKWRIDSPTY